MTTSVPTLYDWLGGIDALERLTARFYERVAQDAQRVGIVGAGAAGVGGGHHAGASSRSRSHSRAAAQSRRAVRSVTPSAAATSATSRPTK